MIKSEIRNPKSETNPKSKTQNPNKSFNLKSLNYLGFKYSFVIGILSFVICIFSAGCEQINKQALDKITQEDPSFKMILTQKEELDGKIQKLLSQLNESKAEADTKIRAIQDEFNKQRREIDAKVTALKNELEPERAKIREGMELLRRDLSAKKSMLRNLEGARRNIENLINQQKAVEVTDKEVAGWQGKLAELNKQITAAEGDIREIDGKLQLLRLKLIALRQ